MRLRSFSLAKIIPVEILHLIIHESSGSWETLRAWCLVSKGALSIAGPELMKVVILTESEDMLDFLGGRLFPELTTSPPFPAIHQHLSTNHTRFLTLNTPMDEDDLLDITEKVAVLRQPQRPRPQLSLMMALDVDGPDTNTSVWIPFVMRLLRPGVLVEADLESGKTAFYSASLTADYLEVLVSHPEEGNQLDNHDYLTNIQRFEIMAMEVVSMTLMWASRIIDAHVSTLRVDMDPVFVRLMDLVESSSWQELKDDLRRMEGGEVLKQQEVEVGTSRLHARAAEIPRLNLKLIDVTSLLESASSAEAVALLRMDA